MRVEPLPFQLSLPGRDSIDFEGIRSVSTRVHGLLHLEGEYAMVEWSTTRRSELVSLTDISEHEHATVALREVWS